MTLTAGGTRAPGEEPILARLREAGHDVGSLAELRGSGVKYPKAVPVLVDALAVTTEKKVLMEVVRALSVPGSPAQTWVPQDWQGAFGDGGEPLLGLGFAGQYLDTWTGLYDLRARDYDPYTGRFTSQDPVTAPVGAPYVSGFAYGFNNPLVFIDATGTWPSWNAIASAVGGYTDGLSFGMTRYAREKLSSLTKLPDPVDYSSGPYKSGSVTGGVVGSVAVTVGATILTAPIGGVGGVAAAGAIAGAYTSAAVTNTTATLQNTRASLGEIGMSAAEGGVAGAALGAGAGMVAGRLANVATLSRSLPGASTATLTAGTSASRCTAAETGASGLPRDALGRFTSRAGGESAATAAGRSAHLNYSNTFGGGDYVFNRALPGSRLRPDAVSYSQNIVRELKPDTPGAISQGWRQVNEYKAYLEELTGQPRTAYVDVYTP